MNSSFLYHAFGVKEYHCHATSYKDSAIFLKLKSDTPRKSKCPHCGSDDVIKYGRQYRDIHNLLIGGKQTFLSPTIQRYRCKDCEKVYQADIPFTRGSVSYTFRFSRYVLDLLRLGMTIKDVAFHLGVGWDMVKDIHKRHLRQKYSYVNIRKVKHIGIDEFFQ
ncbi:transposase family protein [Bacteroides heparinolyticus]|uniref:Transposase n=1 Tax=Prevotella heparinolytica TaxID=28113 RepID=A0A3P2ACD8_9BACE|nr:transposase family protein [Bacteroides heparinolyticus]RRD93097.1 transposase [Bacteroides heparinolyticus]